MKDIIKSSWPLFFGVALLIVGNGLQGTLLGIRATMEGFSTATTGIIMSLYFAGYFIGSILTPRLVNNVGHIRVFAALASLASTTALLYGLFIDPYIWGFSRIIAGFCFAGLYIVIESWMNDISTNQNRGKIMGLYLLIFYGATAMGQYFMNFFSPEKIELFVITSILISLALLPISLSKRPGPRFESCIKTKLKKIFKTSPLGVIGIFFGSFGNGTFFALGSVYAFKSGMDVSQVANFIAVFAIGGVAIQIPLGLLSDIWGRRKIIIAIAFCSALSAMLAFSFISSPLLFYFCVFLYGATALSIYGICVAYVNDFVTNEEFVGVSALLALVNGAGAFLGPLITSLIMTIFGQEAFFPLLAIIYACICLFALYRSGVTRAMPVEDQSQFVAMPPLVTPITAQIAEDSKEEPSRV